MAKFAHLAELVRNPLERVIVAEHHIPNLGGKDHEHAGELEAEIALRKQCHQRQNQTGHEP